MHIHQTNQIVSNQGGCKREVDERDYLENLQYFVLKKHCTFSFSLSLVISSDGMNQRSEDRMRIPIFAQTVDHKIYTACVLA